MKYTIENFRNDFPHLKDKHYKDFEFVYACALKEMTPNDSYKETDYFQCHIYDREFTYEICSMNVYKPIKKYEIFIAARLKNLPNLARYSAIKGTGIISMAVQRPSKKYKNRYGLDRRIMSYLSKKLSKKQAPIYRWFNQENQKLINMAHEVTRDLNNSFCYLDSNTKELVEFNARTKRIKTKYGHENDCYSGSFVIEKPWKKHSDFFYLNFKNKEEFKNAKFPLYEKKINGHIYLIEESDFTTCTKTEVEYVNQWENALIEIEEKRESFKKWRDDCLDRIKFEVYKNYPEYI